MKLKNYLILFSLIISIQCSNAQAVSITNEKESEFKFLGYAHYLFSNSNKVYHFDVIYSNNSTFRITERDETNSKYNHIEVSDVEFKKILNLGQTVYFHIIEYYRDSLSIVFSVLSKDETQRYLHLYRLSGQDINNFSKGELRQIAEIDLPKKVDGKQHQDFNVVLSNDSIKVMYAIAPEIENNNKFYIHYGICELDGNNHYQNKFLSDNSSFYDPIAGNKKSFTYTGKDKLSISNLFVGDHGTVICFLDFIRGHIKEGTISYVFNPENMKTSVLPLGNQNEEIINDISFFQLPNHKILITTYRHSFNKENNEKHFKSGVYGLILDEKKFGLSTVEPALLSNTSIRELDPSYNPDKNSFPNKFLVGGVRFSAPIAHNNEIYFIGQSSHIISGNHSSSRSYNGIIIFKFNSETEKYEYFGGDYNNQISKFNYHTYTQLINYTAKIYNNKLFIFINDDNGNTDQKSNKAFSHTTKNSHYKVVRFDENGNKKVYRFSPFRNSPGGNPPLSLPSAYFENGSLVFYGINLKANKTYKVTFSLDEIL